MFTQCLLFAPLWPSALLLNEMTGILLYFPWFVFSATWFLSLVFYDSDLLIINALVNYALFTLLTTTAAIVRVESSIAIPCESYLFDLYRFVAPSPTYVVTLSYYCLFILKHRNRQDWWEGRMTSTLSIWFTQAVLAAMPLGYILALLYTRVMTSAECLGNTLLVAIFTVAFHSFSRFNRGWHLAARRITHYMHWKP